MASAPFSSRPQIAHGYSLKSVGALRRVEQVGGQLRVEYEPVQRQMLGQEPLHHGFDAVAQHFLFPGKNQPSRRRILIAIGVPAHRVHSLAVAYLYAVKPFSTHTAIRSAARKCPESSCTGRFSTRDRLSSAFSTGAGDSPSVDAPFFSMNLLKPRRLKSV